MVKTPVDAVVAPIGVPSIVLFVIVALLITSEDRGGEKNSPLVRPSQHKPHLHQISPELGQYLWLWFLLFGLSSEWFSSKD